MDISEVLPALYISVVKISGSGKVIEREKVATCTEVSYASITAKMCIAKPGDNPKCKMLNRSTLGNALRGVLAQANIERRLICGLLPAINFLGKYAEDALLCVISETKPGDATTHMQTVLLQAYCYENYIPVIQVDSAEKLATFCGMPEPQDFVCAIISRDMTIPCNLDEDLPLSPGEQKLTDFYECTLEEYPRPIIQLPR